MGMVRLTRGQLMARDFSKLKRNHHDMPSFVKAALEDHALMQDYLERPPYQQNDYIGWINQAKQEATKQKRLSQMLAELKHGGVYMKMAHPASVKSQYQCKLIMNYNGGKLNGYSHPKTMGQLSFLLPPLVSPEQMMKKLLRP